MKAMKNVVCFGEIMLRLNPQSNLRLVQADDFVAAYAGSEASVAVSLSNFDRMASFVSKVPKNEIGRAAVNALRRYGVDTSGMAEGGERLGIYFVEKGASQRPSKVLYDRKCSAFATAVKDDYDWDHIFENAAWFHFSGISPALSGNAADICLEACRKAKEKGIVISCDINYRSKLWNTQDARRVMSELMEYVDVCMGNEEDAAQVFGIGTDGGDKNYQKIDCDSYRITAEKLLKKFRLKAVAFTMRESVSADRNLWSGLFYDGSNLCVSDKYDIAIVDRLGAGDSFSAGIIFSLLNNFDPMKTVQFAAAASCLKHTIESDFNLITQEEVFSLMNGNGSGRVQR